VLSNISKAAVEILLKRDVVLNIFPSCFKAAFKVEQISAAFQIMPGRGYNS